VIKISAPKLPAKIKPPDWRIILQHPDTQRTSIDKIALFTNQLPTFEVENQAILRRITIVVVACIDPFHACQE